MEPKKRTIKLKKSISLPPPADPNIHWTPAVEAMEIVREHFARLNEPVPEFDVDWCIKAIEAEKLEDPRAMPAWLAAAVANVEADPYASLGPMPSHGTGEFWAWCRKRKAIRIEKEVAILAAGGTLPVKKTKAKAKAKESV